MKKYCKNFKVGLDLLFSIAFIFVIMLPVSIMYPKYYILPGILLLIIITYSILILFVEPMGLLYFVSFDEAGIKKYFCKKLIKSYEWAEVEKIEITNPFRSGKYFRFKLRNGSIIYISTSKKVETEIKKYFTIEEAKKN